MSFLSLAGVPEPTFFFDQVLFPEEDQLKRFLKLHTNTKRAGKSQLALLRYLINWNLDHGVINRTRHFMDLPFIRATLMRSLCQNYVPIRDACLTIHGSYLPGSHAMHVTGFTDQFISLVARGVFDARQRHKSSPTPETNALFHPGNDDDNYTRSPNTARRFCPVGRMPKEALHRLFPGCHDFDMRNCYANIVLNWAGELGYEVPPELQLLRADRDGFYASLWREERLINTLHPADRELPPRDVAKLLVQKMIHPSAKLQTANGRRKTGCHWYDELCNWFDAIYHMCGVERSKVHLELSKVEAAHIQTAVEVVGEDLFLVDKHDGFVCAQVPDDRVDHFLQELEARTGIPWTCETFED